MNRWPVPAIVFAIRGSGVSLERLWDRTEPSGKIHAAYWRSGPVRARRHGRRGCPHTLVILPVTGLLFFFTQRLSIRGIALTGIK